MSDQHLLLSLGAAHLQAVAALAIAGAAAWMLRRRPAGLRHAVRAAGVLLALLVPVAAIWMPSGPFAITIPLLEPDPDSAAAEAPALPRQGDLVLQTTPASRLMTVEPPAAAVPAAAAVAPMAAAPKQPAPSLPPIPPPLRWSTVLLWAWGAGALLLLARIAIQHAVAMRRGARSVPVEDDFALALLEEVRGELCPGTPVNLLIGAHASIPYMRGLRTVDVVVPAECADWTPERWELVLRHELGHVRRGDFLWHQLASLLCALHWPNPLVWRAARCLRADSERACDDSVLSAGLKPSDYASLLVDFARQAPPLQAAALAIARPNDLVARVESILDPATPRLAKGASPMKRTLLLSTLLVLSFLMVDVRVVARDRSEAAAAAAMKRDPDPAGEAWFSVAWEAHQKKDYAFSALGFAKAAQAGHAEALSNYNAACALAMLGRRDEAFKQLDLAVDAGFMDVGQIEGDSDFDALRSDERFGTVIETIKQRRAEKRRSWGQWLASWMDDEATPSIEATDAKESAKRGSSRESWLEFAGEAEKIAAKMPANGEVRFQLGYAYLMVGDGAKALPHFEAALAAGHLPEASEYNIACAHALAGDGDAAMDVLQNIAAEEKLWRHDIARDYDLRSLRGRTDFRNLVEQQREGRGMGNSAMRAVRGAVVTVSSNAGKWANAAKDDASKFYQAYDLHMDGQYEESIPMFRQCYEAGINPDKSSYNIACGYAQLGKDQEAFDWLRIAIGEGVMDGFDIAADSDMKRLLPDPRFAEIMQLVERRQALIG